MLASRSALAARRLALGARSTPVRTFVSSAARLGGHGDDGGINVNTPGVIKPLSEIKTKADLLAPGAKPGTIPTDLDQATGLERLELLGKISGVEVFDMKPLDSSRIGTMEDPIVVQVAAEEQYLGCRGSPAGSHNVLWLTVSRTRPYERCLECGSVYKMEYTGQPVANPEEHQGPPEPKTFADYVRPEYTDRYPKGWTGIPKQ